MLAPQRGPIATGEKQLQWHETRWTMGSGKTKTTARGILPEATKFDCLSGRAGELPIALESSIYGFVSALVWYLAAISREAYLQLHSLDSGTLHEA